MAFSVKENALYVAVEVRDESIVRLDGPRENFTDRDACELYLDPTHEKCGSCLYQRVLSDESLDLGEVWAATGPLPFGQAHEWRGSEGGRAGTGTVGPRWTRLSPRARLRLDLCLSRAPQEEDPEISQPEKEYVPCASSDSSC